MSPSEYKRQTLAGGKYIVTDQTMSSSAPAPTPADSAPVSMDTSQTSAPAPPAETATPTPESQNPIDYMTVFQKAADHLNDEEKKIFIEGQLSKLRQLEDAEKRAKDGESNNAMLQETHKKQIKQTMDTIRNFFL